MTRGHIDDEFPKNEDNDEVDVSEEDADDLDVASDEDEGF